MPRAFTQRCSVGGAVWLGTVCKLSTRLQGPERAIRIGVGEMAHRLLLRKPSRVKNFMSRLMIRISKT